MIGMEAIFDSGDRHDFKKKLCECIGRTTSAFPDWLSPIYPPPKETVEEIAIPLYTLRSKLAHGADLRKAMLDPRFPVDLVKEVSLISEMGTRSNAEHLAEAACYLLCQVLQKVF